MVHWFGRVRDRVLTTVMIVLCGFMVSLLFASMGAYLVGDPLALEYARLVSAFAGSVAVVGLFDLLGYVFHVEKDLRREFEGSRVDGV